jgi:hypothetical protein
MDLDSSSDEEDGEVDADTGTISIPRALLKQLSTRSRELTKPQIPHSTPSQALVLFRPLPRIEPRAAETPTDKQETIVSLDSVVREDDAMDVEPW